MKSSRLDARGVLAGLLFILIGVVLGADAYLAWDIAPALMWSGLLIAGGILLLLPREGVRMTDDDRAAQGG